MTKNGPVAHDAGHFGGYITVMTGNQTVQSVARTLQILEIISNEKEIGIREISRRSGVSRATVQRLVSTLVEYGYLNQNISNQKYHLSIKVFHLGNSALFQNDLRSVARPILENLLKKVRETIVLGILDGTEVVYLDKFEIPQELEPTLTVGSRIPLHCTASGKAVLAFMPEGERAKILKEVRLTAYTHRTLTDVEDLNKDLEKTRFRGYAISIEERFYSMISVAAPVLDYSGKVLGSIGIPSFNYRIPEERIPFLGEIVLEAAREISIKLGYPTDQTLINFK